MNKDELKKKIVKVLQELRASKPIAHNDYGLQIILCTTDREIADALIAAGIGDLKEHRIFAGKDGSIKQLYSDEEVEDIARQRDEYKHRAEVAERALEERATYCAMEDFDYFSLTTVAVEARAKELYNGWVQQAEKDLAKEKRNDEH